MADDGAETKGKFLVRAKKPDQNLEYILSVIFKGAPTHHQLVREGEGEEFTLNKTGTGCTTLTEVSPLHWHAHAMHAPITDVDR